MRTPRPPSIPAADRDISDADVSALMHRMVGEPGVDLTGLRLHDDPEPVSEGWDNLVYRIGSLGGEHEAMVLRVPRRMSAVELLARELAALRLVGAGGETPMRIPQLLATVGDDDAPEALVLRWIPGHMAARARIDERAVAAELLADMLATVHRPAPAGMARNPVRGVGLATRTTAMRRDLDQVDLPDAAVSLIENSWRMGLDADEWSGEDLLLHGDPHPGNIVVGDDGEAPVLIDWGDTTAGDPASDLGGLLVTAHVGEGAVRGPWQPSAVLSRYRRQSTWHGVEDDRVWDALVRRAHAWAARYALSMTTAYTAAQPLGAVGRGYLGVGPGIAR